MRSLYQRSALIKAIISHIDIPRALFKRKPGRFRFAALYKIVDRETGMRQLSVAACHFARSRCLLILFFD